MATGHVAESGGGQGQGQGQGQALVLREPHGVVAAWAPWNAPYILATRAVAYPLAAGNTVVLKGAERAPRTMWAVGSVVAEAVEAEAATEEEGADAGILSVVYSAWDASAAATEALIAHPAVRKINFAGSTAVGRVVGQPAGAHLKPVLLELGGKAAAIVWRDADLAQAADACAVGACAVGAFRNAGQICMSTERIVVHADVAAAFAERLAASMRALYGDAALQMVDADAAVAQGAQVVAGRLEDASSASSSSSMAPVVVAGVTPAMALYDTESFGPAASLFTVATEAEALALANDSAYGLTAAVFTADLRRGLRMTRGLEAGAVHINRMTVHDEPALPHGGVKASGFGRFNASLDEWVRTKTVTFEQRVPYCIAFCYKKATTSPPAPSAPRSPAASPTHPPPPPRKTRPGPGRRAGPVAW